LIPTDLTLIWLKGLASSDMFKLIDFRCATCISVINFSTLSVVYLLSPAAGHDCLLVRCNWLGKWTCKLKWKDSCYKKRIQSLVHKILFYFNKRDSAGSDDTASMIKGGGYVGARTRQPPHIRVTRVTRMAYSPSLWLMAIGNWLVKQNQPVSKIETKSDTNLRSLYESWFRNALISKSVKLWWQVKNGINSEHKRKN